MCIVCILNLCLVFKHFLSKILLNYSLQYLVKHILTDFDVTPVYCMNFELLLVNPIQCSFLLLCRLRPDSFASTLLCPALPDAPPSRHSIQTSTSFPYLLFASTSLCPALPDAPPSRHSIQTSTSFPSLLFASRYPLVYPSSFFSRVSRLTQPLHGCWILLIYVRYISSIFHKWHHLLLGAGEGI